MPTKSKAHTPTPWKLIQFETRGTEAFDENDRQIGYDNIKSGFVLLQGDDLFAFDEGQIYNDYETYRSVKVVAKGFDCEAPFVRAVNCHEELLEACKLAEKFLDLTPDEMKDSEEQGQEAWETVRKAIAKIVKDTMKITINRLK